MEFSSCRGRPTTLWSSDVRKRPLLSSLPFQPRRLDRQGPDPTPADTLVLLVPAVPARPGPTFRHVQPVPVSRHDRRALGSRLVRRAPVWRPPTLGLLTRPPREPRLDCLPVLRLLARSRLVMVMKTEDSRGNLNLYCAVLCVMGYLLLVLGSWAGPRNHIQMLC